MHALCRRSILFIHVCYGGKTEDVNSATLLVITVIIISSSSLLSENGGRYISDQGILRPA